MKLAVVGSRTFNDYPYMKKLLNDLLLSYQVFTCTIVSGGAHGADRLSERYAQEENHYLEVYPAEWDKYGKSAGYRCNQQIVDNCDMVAAFWDGESKGTRHTIDLAKEQGKPTYIFTKW